MADQKAIPVELLTYALKTHKISMLKVFLFFKYQHDGYVLITRGSLQKYCDQLSVSRTTLNKQIKKLIAARWITVDGIRGAYRIISYKVLAKRLNFLSYSVVFFEQRDFPTFKAFAIASVITYYMKRKKKDGGRSVYEKWMRHMNHPPLSFYSLPNSYLAKILKISQSLACDYKHLAVSAGYLKITHRKKVFNPSNRNNALLNNSLYINPNATWTHNNLPFIQESDIIDSKIRLGRSRSLKNLNLKPTVFRCDKSGLIDPTISKKIEYLIMKKIRYNVTQN